MFTARRAIIAFFVLLSLTGIQSLYQLMQPPDSGGLGHDSYGTRAPGYRATFETLQKLRARPKRSFVPPPASLSEDDTLVLIAPNNKLVNQEPAHLRKTARWVEDGGHAVIALLAPDDDWMAKYNHSPYTEETSVLEELGLPDIQLTEIKTTPTNTREDMQEQRARRKRENLGTFQISSERPTASAKVALTGTLTRLGGDIKHLRLPRDGLQVMEPTTATTSARVTLASDTGINYTLVATLPRGKGQITIVSDAAIYYNHLLDKQDNAVLAVDLLSNDNGAIVFDEFYHGLNVRGNPLWLLTQPHYAAALATLLLGLALWIWRQATVLGPPLPERIPSRRTIAEYLDAMSSLFLRANRRKFLLAELRDGVLWALRERLKLPPGQEKVEPIAAALHRRQPEKARQLESACRNIERLIADENRIQESSFTHAAQEINKCL